ncbi:monoacylglycerol lipase ABHD6-like [Lolium rigidum]|uniref:monoacylglycerol lipase ABHD6-like n=1 Tax=Lolium rigidum TaxID=89674 RepID=UPI001F5C639D|nr:monoacylglycerol lipase ABHD6-like [Lolium rigidum]
MAPLPAQEAQHTTRRRRSCILSFTAARDRCLRRRFLSAGLRPFSIRLPSAAGPGTTVHVWAPPRPERRAVLLLHGFGASATWQWAPYLRKLIAAGLDPIVPDLLFFGASSSPVPDRSEIFQARTVKAAMDAMGVRRFAVVGVSYGGFVAYRMAALYPEAVERTVLVCAGVCLEQSDLSRGLFPVSDVGEAAELLIPRRPAEVRRLVRLTFVRPPPIMPSCFLKDYINVLGSDHIEEKTDLLHTLINDRKLSDLPKIKQPTLIIWGEKDQVFPMELAHRLERHLGENSRLVVVKNAGHAVNLEKYKEVRKNIIEHLREPVSKDDESSGEKEVELH